MKLNLTALYNVHSGLKLAFGPSARVLRSWLMCALAALLFPVVSGAQTATGAQPLGSLTGGPDAINLGNLNIHYAFPVFSRPGRGMNFTYVLTYDNSIYQPLVSGSGTSWAPVTNFGWRGQTEVATGYISDKTTSQECFLSGTHDLGGMTTLTTYAYHDAFGGTHAISGIHKVIENDGAANCPADSDPPFDGTARDNSGYGVHADDTSIYATAKGGAQIHAPVNSTTGAATATDSNGNQIIVDASGNFADTLGTTALSISGSENAPPMSFIYHDTTGAPQSVVVNYAAMTVETFFQCANIGEYGPIAANLPTSISYPDGSSYVITYEQTPNGSGHVTGRVASVPTSHWRHDFVRLPRRF